MNSPSEIRSPLIKTTSLGKIFKRGDELVGALDNINLEIASGEFVAISGASGSGKSTLLHILGLLDVPTSGSYSLSGKEVSGLTEKESAGIRNATFGFIFQSFHLMPKLSALENVAMPLFYSPEGSDRAQYTIRAQEALSLVHLEGRMRHLPNELSGGQRQRVAIARALIGNPKVVLADEPTGNLDSKNASEVIDLLFALQRKGVTVILVTHDNEIAARAPRKIFLKDGVITSDDRGGVRV
jgi:putative ABC transport system ATP-binding protein